MTKQDNCIRTYNDVYFLTLNLANWESLKNSLRRKEICLSCFLEWYLNKYYCLSYSFNNLTLILIYWRRLTFALCTKVFCIPIFLSRLMLKFILLEILVTLNYLHLWSFCALEMQTKEKFTKKSSVVLTGQRKDFAITYQILMNIFLT